MKYEEGTRYVCVYTTHNEHEAQLIRIGLEGEGIRVILQIKSDVEAPNSPHHKAEVFVSAKDYEKAKKFLRNHFLGP